MKKKQIIAVSTALVIGTATVLAGTPTPVMAQENIETVQEIVLEENKTEKDSVKENEEIVKTVDSTMETETKQEKVISEKQPMTEETETPKAKAGNIVIDEANFPDVEFRKYVKENFDTDNDNTMSNAEISKATNITIAHTKLKSVKGIEVFSNLERLDLSFVSLTDLDLSKNTNLTYLNLRGIGLEGFDVSKNTKLKELDGSSNFLWFNIGNNLNLEKIEIGDTNLWCTIEGNKFNFKERLNGCDLSKVTITSNGTLDKNTGIATIYDVKKPLTYEYDCGTYNGGKKTLRVNIIVQTKTLPEIFANDVVLNVGDIFNPLANVTATDFEDGPITLTEDNIIQNDVDTSKAGVYHVTYKVTDKNGGSTRKVITVTVKDSIVDLNTVPTISASDVTLNVGDAFDPLANVTATDFEDGTITLTKDNIIANDVDTSKAGTYHVTFQVIDRNGAVTEKTITVTVKAKDANKPVTLEKPQQPEQPNKPSNAPQTGDVSNLGLLVSMFAGSTGALAVLLGKKRKKDNE